MLKTALTSIASALVIAVLVSPLHAAVVTNVEFPFEWSLPTSQCSALTSDVTGTGTFHLLVGVTPDGGGGFHIVEIDSMHGTATDTNGGRYVFNYEKPTTQNVRRNIDYVTRTDSFTLQQQGPGGIHINVRFVAKFNVDSNGTFTVTFLKIGGDPACDPI